MKMLTFISAMALAIAAQAYTTVNHDYRAALGGIALENACITSTQIKSINPVRRCTAFKETIIPDGEGSSHSEWTCEKWEMTQLTQSRTFMKSVCTEWKNDEIYSGCVKSEMVKDFMPSTIVVTYITESGDVTTDWPGVKKNFTFPSCK